MTLLEAMARMEGFGKPGTRPTRNHNPGDLEYGSFSVSHGATGTDGRFAIFPSDDVGFEAMRALLVKHYSGLTLEQALNKYAPPAENNTNVYLENVCKWVGCNPTDIIDGLLNVQAV